MRSLLSSGIYRGHRRISKGDTYCIKTFVQVASHSLGSGAGRLALALSALPGGASSEEDLQAEMTGRLRVKYHLN